MNGGLKRIVFNIIVLLASDQAPPINNFVREPDHLNEQSKKGQWPVSLKHPTVCPTYTTSTPQKASHQGLSWEQVTFVAFFRHLFHLESQAGFRHLSSRIRQPMCISHHVNSSKNHQPNVSPHKDRHEHEFPFRVSHA